MPASGNVYNWRTSLSAAMNGWHDEPYPLEVSARRLLQIRVQKSLHSRAPVGIRWAVDFNALDRTAGSPTYGAFTMSTLTASGKPGSQGLHLSVMEACETVLASGDVLEAGITLNKSSSKDRAKLQAALAPESTLKFLRIKNSWGSTYFPTEGMGGYHDLYLSYLDGPIAWCSAADPSSCQTRVLPFASVLLPPGF